jgi:glutathione S-transferase
MRLFYSPTSPYARKARIVAREKGLLPRLEEMQCDPWSDPAALRFVNPLGRVPALVTDEGEALYDSPVICAYFNDQSPLPALIPLGEGRYRILAAEALADGMIDTAVSLVLEGRRPEPERSAKMALRWLDTIDRAVLGMAEAVPHLPGELTIGHISIAVALGYLDFRLPQVDWRTGHEALATWHKGFAARPSMLETQPPVA